MGRFQSFVQLSDTFGFNGCYDEETWKRLCVSDVISGATSNTNQYLWVFSSQYKSIV